MGVNRHRILLVDDDPLLRRIRAEILAHHGYSVCQAENLDDAIARCEPGAYDLVLLNGQEDESAAIETCEELKRLNPDQVVIVLALPTAYVPADSCPDDVVSEGPRELLVRVEAALGAEAGSPS
jgi:CheY-like chemotaxis protein